ncbi:MAG: DUF3038 domain-containing protein [Synechococcaceae cyanobacterium SM2_3_2]|nr:DUF3038 domain-containing protein [Synechococcaceae cyanobacterium SM2_3_2]
MTVDDKHPSLAKLKLVDGIPIPASATSTTKVQLDLLLLGLECLSGESSGVVLEAAKDLGVDQWVSDRVNLWRLRNASPLRRSSGGRKKLDIEEAQALVLVISHLAVAQQAKIRSAVEHLQAAVEAERSPFQDPQVADYLDEFHSHYRSQMVDGDDRSSDSITEIGLKILVDLLFYSSSKRGSQRLWQALLQRPEMTLPPLPSETLETEGSQSGDGDGLEMVESAIRPEGS